MSPWKLGHSFRLAEPRICAKLSEHPLSFPIHIAAVSVDGSDHAHQKLLKLVAQDLCPSQAAVEIFLELIPVFQQRQMCAVFGT